VANLGKRAVFQITELGRTFNYNLGASLQAYALHYAIKMCSATCVLIDYVPGKRAIPSFKSRMYSALVAKTNRVLNEVRLPYFLARVVADLPGPVSRKIERFLEKERMENIRRFKEKWFEFTERTFHTFDEFEALRPDDIEDNVYIVGSDVVWAPRYQGRERLKVFLLAFVRRARRASYAASVGDPIPENLRPLFKKHLSDFDSISVREESSAEYLREAVSPHLRIEVVLDPVCLLSRDDWLKVSRPPTRTPGWPYILVYDLCRSEDIAPGVAKFAKEQGLGVVAYSLPFDRDVYPRQLDTFYFYDPSEFLWLVNGAEYVVTSSFHGTALSVIFHKPFAAVNPEPFAPVTRIGDFLVRMGAEDRIVDDPKLLSEETFGDIDWGSIERHLSSERRHSWSYLRRVVAGD